MPNWVKNVVKIKRVKNEDKEKIIDLFTFKDENGEKYFDFNKIIERPKRLNLISGTTREKAVKYALFQKNEKTREELINILKKSKEFWFSNFKNINIIDLEKEAQNFNPDKQDSFEKIDYEGLNIKTFEDLGNAYIQNVLDYGCSDWYEWSIRNWGTKWNACDSGNIIVGENYIKFIFETAWSTSEPIFQKMSEMIDNDIEIWFADEDIGSNCGKIYFFDEGSQEFENKQNNRDFANRVWRM